MALSIALSGIAVGAGFGFVIQRGRFCFNTAFRNIIYIKDFTLFRSYALALTVSVIGAQALQGFRMLSVYNPQQTFSWIANIGGGYILGVGMTLAAGGASGTWYRAGEGLMGSWIAALGFMIGASAADTGALSGIVQYIRSFVLSPCCVPTIYNIIGVNKWIVVGLVTVAGAAFAFGGKAETHIAQTGYGWRATGALVGLLIVLGLYVSELMTGLGSGITFPAPSSRLLTSISSGLPWNWGVYMLAGVPIGAFISAMSLHEFSWRAPRADVMAQQLLGGVLMGIGGILSGGCEVGHGLTGLAMLYMPSLVSIVFIILGSWTMVYFFFIRSSARRGV